MLQPFEVKRVTDAVWDGRMHEKIFAENLTSILSTNPYVQQSLAEHNMAVANLFAYGCSMGHATAPIGRQHIDVVEKVGSDSQRTGARKTVAIFQIAGMSFSAPY